MAIVESDTRNFYFWANGNANSSLNMNWYIKVTSLSDLNSSNVTGSQLELKEELDFIN